MDKRVLRFSISWSSVYLSFSVRSIRVYIY